MAGEGRIAMKLTTIVLKHVTHQLCPDGATLYQDREYRYEDVRHAPSGDTRCDLWTAQEAYYIHRNGIKRKDVYIRMPCPYCRSFAEPAQVKTATVGEPEHVRQREGIVDSRE